MELQIGLTVKVLSNAEYDNQFEGCYGVIERHYSHKMVGIKIDGHRNSASGYGVYWFSKDHLQIIGETTEMIKNFNTATIEFLDGNTYSQYPYALYDESIKTGDLVVLNTGHHGFALGKIANISTDTASHNLVKCGREVICKVDMTAFEERRERAKKLAALEKQIDEQVREFTKLEFLESMAAKHPELKDLLEEYKKLQ